MINEKELEMIRELVGTEGELNVAPAYVVLTALRGPDIYIFGAYAEVKNATVQYRDRDIKEATAGVIRWHLGIKHSLGIISGSDNLRLRDARLRICVETAWKQSDPCITIQPGYLELSHYLTHSYAAFKELGLLWGEVNR